MTPIVYKDWEKLTIELGGICWETGDKLPDAPYVFSTAEHIDNLFRDILEAQDYTNKFILISSASDSGLYLQNDINGIVDIRNWANMDPNLDEAIGYHDYICRSRHEKQRCLYRDKYCFKMYSWMASTFPVIPKNIVRWFTSNCQIQDERVVPIPFGINPDALKPIKVIIDYIPSMKIERTNKVVACWSNTTNQRAYIKSALDKSMFYTDSCDQHEFFRRLLSSKYCLCPEGNGLDCYRILECLYLGCVPIIVSNLVNPIWQKAYQIGLPIVRPNEIGGCLSNLMATDITLERFKLSPAIYMEYWKERITQGDTNVE